MVVPYDLPRREIPRIDEDLEELEIVTDMWVERCLRRQAFVAPEAHITSTPFPRFPIPGSFHRNLHYQKRILVTCCSIPRHEDMFNRVLWD